MDRTISHRGNSRLALAQALRGTVGVLVFLLFARTWLLEPFVVTSGSMAPTLLGVHAEVVCKACGNRFTYGLDYGPAGRVLCSNCSRIQFEESDPPATEGDRVLVDRSTFDWRSPRRWEPVAFLSPTTSRQIVVKRVVGLPGESIEIRDGDAYASGQILRKSLAEQRALAIPVHVEAAAPKEPAAGAARWRADHDPSGWRRQGERFLYVAPGGSSESQPAWLVYRHQALEPGSSTHSVDAPVADLCSYNQTQPRQQLYAVRDLALGCQLRASGPGQLLVSATDGVFDFLLRLDLEHQQAELLRDGRRMALAQFDGSNTSCQGRLYVSLVDRQVCVAWNDRVLFYHPYERPAHPDPASDRPFRIAAAGVALDVWDLRVDRDVYYTPPAVAGPSRSNGRTKLGQNEFFVLGDNSPQSRDSRANDFGPGVPRHLLIGKPLVVYFPARIVQVWGWTFQVPEMAKIRYIR